MVKIIKIIHKWVENNKAMDAIPGEIFMYEFNIIFISIKCKREINININDSKSSIINSINW